ncbi:hypothetical protein [Caulobacter mirabilis]|uniref:hypothetical protein n=1 Tax=Caulobacter mirabilis TaxID=69666 RepID=UPI0012370E79|nr:hypothetical protein [Caulobacter mirabilis]
MAIAVVAAGLAATAIGYASFARQQQATPAGMCGRFDLTKSSAYAGAAQPIAFPWRRDLPQPAANRQPHAWDSVQKENWEAYMAAFLSEVKAGGLAIADGKAAMKPDAEWWIAPWMDYGDNGREKNLGLTKERNPGKGDLAPGSGTGRQVWAVGFYNREGAAALGQVFADPCNPQVPQTGWSMPEGAASFKLLFTTATAQDAAYLDGSPEVQAFIGNRVSQRTQQTVRLLQMDIAIRDNDSPTGWILGTYIWKGPKTGDGLFDNLVPVGLMWGNDPNAAASPRDAMATLTETRLNPALAGVVWRGHGQTWDERPWPGFQGRLNGPADNMISTCMSCHALAQWPRSKALSILPTGPTYTMATLNNDQTRAALAASYLKNVPGGTLTDPSEATPTASWGGARPLDYSLQLEAAFTRMCNACADGVLSGPTPAMCQVKGAANYVAAANCPTSAPVRRFLEGIRVDKPARQ